METVFGAAAEFQVRESGTDNVVFFGCVFTETTFKLLAGILVVEYPMHSAGAVRWVVLAWYNMGVGVFHW